MHVCTLCVLVYARAHAHVCVGITCIIMGVRMYMTAHVRINVDICYIACAFYVRIDAWLHDCMITSVRVTCSDAYV